MTENKPKLKPKLIVFYKESKETRFGEVLMDYEPTLPLFMKDLADACNKGSMITDHLGAMTAQKLLDYILRDLHVDWDNIPAAARVQKSQQN
jgi:hypothetical protein